MARRSRWIIAIAALIGLPSHVYSERIISRVATHSDVSILLSDKTLKNRHIELISSKGTLVQGKLAGFSDGAVRLQAAPAVPLCGIALVKLSRNSARPLRKFAGIAGGILAGQLLGAPLGFSAGVAGFDAAAAVMFLAFPVAGGWAGSKLARKREHTVYLVDPAEKTCPSQNW